MNPSTLIALGATVLVAIGAAYAFRNRQDDARRLWPYVWIATTLLAVVYAAYSIWRHTHFESHAFDLGLYDQAFWHLSRFQSPASTIRGIANIFGDHFHPLIMVLVPFYWLFRSPVVLLAGQAVFLAAALPAAYALAIRLKVPAVPAFALAIATASNPGMVLTASFDFHEVALAPALILASALAFESRRWYWAAIVGLLLLKESVSAYAALLGVTFALRAFLQTRRFDRAVRHGLATVAVGLTAFLLVTRLVIPALSGGQGFIYWNQYRAVGATPAQLAWNVVAHPARTLGTLVDDPDKRHTERAMLATFAGLPLLSWTTWPALLLAFGERFWSSSINLWLLQFHYQQMMIGVFALSTLYVLHDLARWRRLRGIAFGAAVSVLVLTGWVYGKLQPWSILTNPSVLSRPVAQWNAALRTIPGSAAVSAQDAFVPHLSHRNTILLFPNLGTAEYVVLDSRAPSWPLTADEVRGWQRTLRADPGWELTQAFDEFTIFRLRPPSGGVPNPGQT